jgi:hypothetical protein
VTSSTWIARLALPLAALALLAGCGGSGSADADRAKAEVRSNWTAFFDGSTPAEQWIGLLQDGDRFASLVRTVNASPVAAQLSADVTSVELTGDSTARVTYTVLLGERRVLEGVKGTSVLVGDVWKVGIDSFCQLLTLQGLAPKACPPPAK